MVSSETMTFCLYNNTPNSKPKKIPGLCCSEPPSEARNLIANGYFFQKVLDNLLIML